MIALVVTVIIVLIIAGISIWTLTGNNNIINQSMEARDKTLSKDLEEEIHQQWLLVQNDTKFEYPTNEELAQELQDRLNKSDSSVQVSYNSNRNTFNVTYKGQSCMINYDGAIVPEFPKEFQQVEYIESTGTQWIDTKVIPTSTLNGTFELMCMNRGYAFGSTNGQNKDYWGVNFKGSNGMFELYLGTGSYPYYGKWKKETKYKISIIDKKFLCDENLMYDFNNSQNSFQFNTNKTIYLFGLNYGGGEFFPYRFYSANFFNNNGKIRDFIPCYTTTTVTDINGKQCPSGTIGLYDTVEGKFYTNQGTGEFLKGEDI